MTFFNNDNFCIISKIIQFSVIFQLFQFLILIFNFTSIIQWLDYQ
jgi:hypothetical protein